MRGANNNYNNNNDDDNSNNVSFISSVNARPVSAGLS